MSNHTLLICLVVLVVVGVGGLSYALAAPGKHHSSDNGGALSVAQRYFAALNARNLGAASALGCGGSVQPPADVSAAGSMITDAQLVGTPSTTGSYATANGSATFPLNGLPATLSLQLRLAKQAGQWCVLAVQEAGTGVGSPSAGAAGQGVIPTSGSNSSTGAASPSVSSSAAPSGGGAPAAPTPTSALSCSLPAGATADGAEPSDLLSTGLSVLGASDAGSWQLTYQGQPESARCYRNISQLTVSSFVAFLSGAGWNGTPTDGGHQLALVRSDELLPRRVIVNVSGSLSLASDTYNSNSGTVQVYWY